MFSIYFTDSSSIVILSSGLSFDITAALSPLSTTLSSGANLLFFISPPPLPTNFRFSTNNSLANFYAASTSSNPSSVSKNSLIRLSLSLASTLSTSLFFSTSISFPMPLVSTQFTLPLEDLN
ncbi:uncharacterized protein VTP21DRAFT_7794 [Calcarisporiella thermophila]|uniref:uncharacterized protein n=1 Tax=Calcarisporiella thermophila TaxID=911321 RepID=UPI0037439237